ncbi:314_t:CDS:1, partial [Ambispora gerdemannii]
SNAKERVRTYHDLLIAPFNMLSSFCGRFLGNVEATILVFFEERTQ